MCYPKKQHKNMCADRQTKTQKETETDTETERPTRESYITVILPPKKQYKNTTR